MEGKQNPTSWARHPQQKSPPCWSLSQRCTGPGLRTTLTQPEGGQPGWREALSQNCPTPREETVLLSEGSLTVIRLLLGNQRQVLTYFLSVQTHGRQQTPMAWKHFQPLTQLSGPGHSGQLTLWVMKVTVSTPIGFPEALPQPGTVFPFSSPSPLRTHQKGTLNPGAPDLRLPSCAVPGAPLSPSLGDPEVLHTFLAHPTSLPNTLPSEPRTPGALGLRLWQLLPPFTLTLLLFSLS